MPRRIKPKQKIELIISKNEAAVSAIYNSALTNLNWGKLFQKNDNPYVIVSLDCETGDELPYVRKFISQLITSEPSKKVPRKIVYIGLDPNAERIEQAKKMHVSKKGFVTEFYRCNLANRAELELVLKGRKANLIIACKAAFNTPIYKFLHFGPGIQALFFNVFMRNHLPVVLKPHNNLLLFYQKEIEQQDEVWKQVVGQVVTLHRTKDEDWESEKFSHIDTLMPPELKQGFYFVIRNYEPTLMAQNRAKNHFKHTAKDLSIFILRILGQSILSLFYIWGFAKLIGADASYISPVIIITFITILAKIVIPLIETAIRCLHDFPVPEGQQLPSAQYFIDRALSLVRPEKPVDAKALGKGLWLNKKENVVMEASLVIDDEQVIVLK